MKNLSKQIVMFRRKIGWAQEELANKTGMAINTLQKLEQGNSLHPTIQTIEKLADAFNISIDKLIGRSIVTDDDIEHALFD